MDRQPDSFYGRIGPVHSMTASGGDVYIISGYEMFCCLYAVKLQLCFACQKQYPFILLLVEPLTIRGGLAVGDNPLYAYAIGLNNNIDRFG